MLITFSCQCVFIAVLSEDGWPWLLRIQANHRRHNRVWILILVVMFSHHPAAQHLYLADFVCFFCAKSDRGTWSLLTTKLNHKLFFNDEGIMLHFYFFFPIKFCPTILISLHNLKTLDWHINFFFFITVMTITFSRLHANSSVFKILYMTLEFNLCYYRTVAFWSWVKVM